MNMKKNILYTESVACIFLCNIRISFVFSFSSLLTVLVSKLAQLIQFVQIKSKIDIIVDCHINFTYIGPKEVLNYNILSYDANKE